VEKRPILRAANLGSDPDMIDESDGDEIEIGDRYGVGVGLVLPAQSHDSGIDLVLSCVPF